MVRGETMPAVILVGAQLGANIGMVARAMLNFGLQDLRLVAPRSGWSKEQAIKASAGADSVLEAMRVYDDLPLAIADLGYVVATSARRRDMVKPVLTPARVGAELRKSAVKCGILFGPERTGLDNEAVSRADVLCRVPLNPDFSSLNLAQAVLLLAYEWHRAGDNTPEVVAELADTRPATQGEMDAMFAHFESALDASGFLSPPEKAPSMARNLRNMLHRANLTEQDVRTFRGVINSLLRWPREVTGETVKPRIATISRGQKDGQGED